MIVEINNEKCEVSNNISLGELIASTPSIPKQGIAVAVNNKVIRKENWEKEMLSDGSKITIIKAFYGG